MPFGAPGFFRDRATTRKPAAVDLTFLYGEGTSTNDGKSLIAGFKSFQNVAELRSALWRENIGIALPNRFSQSDCSRFMAMYPDDIWLNDTDTVESWGGSRYVPGFPIGITTIDITGATHAIATTNPRYPVDPESGYRPGVQRIILNISAEQPPGSTSKEAEALAALTASSTAQIYAGVGSFQFALTNAPPSSAQYFGAVFLDQSSQALLIGRTPGIGGYLFRETPLADIQATYAYTYDKLIDKVTRYEPITPEQIMNGPIVLGGSFQTINMLHLAYKTSGAVIGLRLPGDVYIPIGDQIEALGLVLGRYLYELT